MLDATAMDGHGAFSIEVLHLLVHGRCVWCGPWPVLAVEGVFLTLVYLCLCVCVCVRRLDVGTCAGGRSLAVEDPLALGLLPV